MCVPLSSNLRWARVPGCVQLSSVSTGLGRESVALGYRVLTLDKSALTQRTATLWREDLTLVLDGIDIALGA